MDEFGVLTERYGLKQQGKAAPMAASKRPAASSPANINEQTLNFGFSSASNQNSSFKSSWSSSSDGHFKGVGDHLDDLFGGSTKSSADQSHVSSFEYDSIFDSTAKSSSGKSNDNDDIFGLNKSTTRSNGDVFSSFPSPPPPPPRWSSPVGDLLGGYHQNDDDIFSGMGNESRAASGNASAKAESNSAGFDDLIPGFGGGSSSSSNGYSNHLQQSSSNATSSEDPFSIFESTSKPPRPSSGIFSDHLEEFGQFSGATRAKDDSVKSPTVSSIDELEEFAMGRTTKSVNEQLKFPAGEKKPPNVMQRNRHREEVGIPRENKHKSGDNLESFFNMNSRSSSAPKSRTASSTNKNEGRGTGQSTSSGTPSSIRKVSSTTNIIDDLSSMFGDASIFGEFEEVEGESEERRKARRGRQTRTQQRVAKAVAEMNQRDYETQLEQEERHRVAENLDADIKRWAAGKEVNMRALLSSLQYVLWPECGWEAVSLTDLITSSAVKKVYRKATLCIHPDKVQQKGASVQQKYIAEKVFDILKEAWKKYEAEELR